MHTAMQLNEEMFTTEIDGQPGELFPDWHPLDRFGIVVHEPFGGIGASFLLQAAIAAWYSVRPERRDRSRLLYPDFYLFHAGGPHGAHTYFDLFPTRKEVFVDNTPIALLQAINDRGITRLAVPDRPVDKVQHAYKEPRHAADRIVSAWAYSATGRVASPDVRISSAHPVVESNTKLTLHAKESYAERQRAIADNGKAQRPENELLRAPQARDHEVSAELRDSLRESRKALYENGIGSETYRRITVDDALGMLHRGPAPAFLESEAFTLD